MGEVVGPNGELVEGIQGGAAHVVAVDEPHSGDIALGGEGEDVGCVEEKEFTDVACGTCLLAEVVVSDEEESGLGVVSDVPDDFAELVSCVDA